MAVSTCPDISHLSVSRPELINALRQMGQQVKWPQKMRAPDSFWNPGLSDPCHIRRFGNQRYKPCSLKEEHLERQARPRGSQAKTPAPGYGRNKLHGQGAGKGRIQGSWLEESALTPRITPLIGFIGKVKQTTGEKLSQLESENLTLQDENQALNTASNKKRRFRTQVCPTPTLETPNSGTGTNLPTMTLGGDASTREKANDAQTYDVEDSESEPEKPQMEQ
ncbi:hypothetical protein F2Q70_00002732 [Brassica cretica]|uniref:Uncharacterized protein n=1 Tax=Brassica cretica TaxID=69181 RepID=A0A8S9J2E3_BRACR|nr:hypothetical protein F2Q70_00002732 [Brassica cretica]